MLFALPAGWISDKVGSRRRPFIVGLLLLSVGNAMIAFGKTFTVLVMARLLQGMSAAIVWTVGIAMVQDTVGPAKLGNAIGLVIKSFYQKKVQTETDSFHRSSPSLLLANSLLHPWEAYFTRRLDL